MTEATSREAIPRKSPAFRGLVTSVIDGAPVTGGRTVPSTNPARLDEVVGEASFGDAATFMRAAESAKKAQESWAAIPAPIRGRAIAHIGRLVENNAEALARLVNDGGNAVPDACCRSWGTLSGATSLHSSISRCCWAVSC